MNLGEKEQLENIKKKNDVELKKELLTECLVVALLMIKNGKTRQADEAVRVYKRLKEKNEMV